MTGVPHRQPATQQIIHVLNDLDVLALILYRAREPQHSTRLRVVACDGSTVAWRFTGGCVALDAPAGVCARMSWFQRAPEYIMHAVRQYCQIECLVRRLRG